MVDVILDAIGQGGLTNLQLTYRIGWWSALACFLTSYFAARQVRSNPRLFTVMALFAGAWVLIMAAIESRSRAPDLTALPDRAADVASFLLVYAGSVLAREGSHTHTLHQTAQRWLQIAGLWLLFLLVLPSQLPLKLPLAPQQIDLALGELLGFVGFLSLLVGARAVATSGLIWPLFGTLLFYEYLSLARAWQLWTVSAGTTRPPMPIEFVYGYVLARFLLTGLFAGIVLSHHSKDAPRREGAPSALRPKTAER